MIFHTILANSIKQTCGNIWKVLKNKKKKNRNWNISKNIENVDIFFKIMSWKFQSKRQFMTSGGYIHDTIRLSNVQIYWDIFSSRYVSLIMPFQIFPLWVRIRKSKIALVTSVTYGYYGGDSTMRTICYVSSRFPHPEGTQT